jgi:hypothetical protein
VSATIGRRRFDRGAIVATAAIVLVIAMALDTTVVRIGSKLNLRAGEFSPAAFGASEFPTVRAYVLAHAVDAATLAAAISKDGDAAAKQYGVATGTGTEFCVKFTGVAGKSDLGDASGAITFGQFHNQIEYQNAAGGLSSEMKKDVLAKIDTSRLTGRTISVVGAFALSDPTSWQVTPVQLTVR